MKRKLSVVLATRNEENNIGQCLQTVKEIADEIVIVDEESDDRTREIAEKFGARVYKVPHESMFHKTKQKALDLATGDWILQLDADERITKDSASEIIKVMNSSDEDILARRPRVAEKWKLFTRHQKLVEQRDGKIGKMTGEVVAFFFPRRNMFLGSPLIHAGVYPDAAIRLIKKEKVHEIMEIGGEVAWLFNDLEHHDSPTLFRYLERLNRYTDLHARELIEAKTPNNPLFLIHYSLFRPVFVFLNLFIRHKGFLDGMRGFLWSFFSASHFPISYFKYIDQSHAES